MKRQKEEEARKRAEEEAALRRQLEIAAKVEAFVRERKYIQTERENCDDAVRATRAAMVEKNKV